ncbi:MAG: aminoglycoside phosphotransferase family protein [Eubacteriales bacterium]|nr:aminoglycoside phosphotransferase family protein [Eubacteriales bacterium]
MITSEYSIPVNMNTDKIISHFGDEFYQSLLTMLAEYREEWELDNLKQIDYYSVNCLFKCTSKRHGECVLKIGKSSDEAQAEYNALSEYAGSRFCRVYEADISNGALLIEQIIPGAQLRAVSDIEKRLDLFCGVFVGLHKQPSDKSKYPTYMGWVTRIAAFMRDKTDFRELSDHMNEAEKICRDLCGKYTGEMLLHGDFHHDNILLGGDNQYHIIDPKGVVGDRVFDIPRFILNEFEDDIKEGFNEKYLYIIETLSKKLSVPKIDLLRLVYVEMCMANSWCVESDEKPNMKDVEFTRSMMSCDN